MLFLIGFSEILGIISVVLLCILVVLIFWLSKIKKNPNDKNIIEYTDKLNKTYLERFQTEFNRINEELNKLKDNNSNFQIDVRNVLHDFQNRVDDTIAKNNEKLIKETKEKFEDFTKNINDKMHDIDNHVKENLQNIQKDNNDKLTQIQGIVDEKLQKTLDERLSTSFNNVLEQIGSVNKTIGEIKGLADDVSSLKNTLANVKTKGILGEVILGNLIEDVLVPTQYEVNCKTNKERPECRVEYAIKLPGQVDNELIYLPVDSKFPTKSYERILTALEDGDKNEIEQARTQLKKDIKEFAKEITKYINVPYTTDFAIMFLPTEGLYAEVINLGLLEELQKNKIVVTGPSTFLAFLNALQMGFKTLTIQKKSADVFKLLSAVKTEFIKFSETLEKAQNNVEKVSKDIDELVGKRTRAIKRKLENIETLPELEAKTIINDEIEGEKND